MDLTGIEPVTSSMPWKRAPSCATGPLFGGTSSFSRMRGSKSNRMQTSKSNQQPAQRPTPHGTNRILLVSNGYRVSEHSATGGALFSQQSGQENTEYGAVFLIPSPCFTDASLRAYLNATQWRSRSEDGNGRSGERYRHPGRRAGLRRGPESRL